MNSKELKNWRIEAGLSQARAAEYLGVSSGSMAHWEAGRRHPPEFLMRLVQLYGPLSVFVPDTLSPDPAVRVNFPEWARRTGIPIPGLALWFFVSEKTISRWKTGEGIPASVLRYLEILERLERLAPAIHATELMAIKRMDTQRVLELKGKAFRKRETKRRLRTEAKEKLNKMDREKRAEHLWNNGFSVDQGEL